MDLDSDPDEMGVILCAHDFRYRVELENYSKTGSTNRTLRQRIIYFSNLNELSRVLSQLDEFIILLNEFEGMTHHYDS